MWTRPRATRCESRTPWASFQTDSDPARLWWTLPFPEPEAEGLGCEDPGCVQGQLHHEGKDREAVLHPPSRQESEAALAFYFHRLVFQLTESVK